MYKGLCFYHIREADVSKNVMEYNLWIPQISIAAKRTDGFARALLPYSVIGSNKGNVLSAPNVGGEVDVKLIFTSLFHQR